MRFPIGVSAPCQLLVAFIVFSTTLATCSLAAVSVTELQLPVAEQLTEGRTPQRSQVRTRADSEDIVTATKSGGTRQGRKFLGKIGFLAGLHIGSGISSSGSLAASHSVKVFGKVMNTALSVSYGPAGHPGLGPGPILNDPPPPVAEDTPLTAKPIPVDLGDRGQEAAAFPHRMALKTANNASRDSEEPPAVQEPGAEGPEGPSTDNEISQNGDQENEVGEEVEPPSTTTKRTLFQYLSRRQASFEHRPASSPSEVNRQRIQFLKDHHRHIATFNQHFQKFSGDVSKVVRIAEG